jgi:ADP-L-glycero-D-manno-heptose 6-epimerase
MIIITGGAGMIGSMVAWHFNAHSQRDDLVLVDRILEADQWQNYCRRDIVEYLDKDELFPWLAARSPKGPRVDAVIHMGAISATTERDFSLLLETNIRYSQRLWEWCATNEVPYLYASSAATYGGGELGYADSHDIATLRPLNGYGFSKQYFDRWALRQAREGKPTPPVLVRLQVLQRLRPQRVPQGTHGQRGPAHLQPDPRRRRHEAVPQPSPRLRRRHADARFCLREGCGGGAGAFR